jgi:hypothetical protein
MEKEFKTCFDFFNDQRNYYFFSKKLEKGFKDCLTQMKDDIEKMQKDETVKFNMRPVFQCNQILEDLVIFNLQEKNFVDFCISFALISFNWNKNGPKFDKLENLTIQINNTCNNLFNVSIIISYMRDVCEKASKLEKIESPSFKLSKHYFDLLKEN